MNALMSGIVLVALFIAVCCEAKMAHDDTKSVLRRSYKTNVNTFVFNNVILSLASVPSLVLVAGNFSQFGILNLAGPWKIPLSFVLLDVTLYAWHRACHTFECLWVFHKVHHSDHSMNVTTAFRVHLIEVFLTTVVKAIFIVVAGVDVIFVLMNETIITLFVMFHHSYMAFSREKLFGLVFVMPSQHRVHHSVLREEHDNNYGAVFSFWDRLFGTFIQAIPEKLGLQNVPAQGFIRLFFSGFTNTGASKPVFREKNC